MFKKDLEKRPRRFKSDRCGYEFIKYYSATVEKCPKCSEVVIDKDYHGRIEDLDPYSYRKYMWYKYPKFHEEDIRTRKVKDVPELV